jgi:hypothetical protein
MYTLILHFLDMYFRCIPPYSYLYLYLKLYDVQITMHWLFLPLNSFVLDEGNMHKPENLVPVNFGSEVLI